MQTALHITALVDELRNDLVDGEIVSTEFYKKKRAAYLFVRKDRRVKAMAFVFHPAGWGTFCVPASKVNIDTLEKPWPIFAMTEGRITGVRQIGLDRIFELVISLEGKAKRMIFEVMGPNGNIWLLDAEGNREATLRNKQYDSSEPYAPPSAGDRLNPFEVTGDQISGLAGSAGESSMLGMLKKGFAGFNETIAREIIHRASLQGTSPTDLDQSKADQLVRDINTLAERFTTANVGYLYSMRGVSEVYPFKLTSVDSQPEKFKSLSLAVVSMCSRKQTRIDEADEERKVISAVGRAVKRLAKRVVKIKEDVARAADYESQKRYAELLQLHRGSLKKGMESAVVEDLMSNPSKSVEIKLEPTLSPNDNIEAYFKRFRKGREGLELLERRLEISQGELAELRTLQANLETDFESASQRYQSELASLMPKVGDKREVQPRLPYREMTLSTGLTVFVGRDGIDNDRTTFEFARPYELWFHTQQCPGSHVVMKFPNKSFEPSKREIEEAASLAAYNSKARHNSLVPVIYCQRKYVRKPRKAKPGLVSVEREKSVMVAPRKSID
ncbi:MAG: hypothetical protein DRI57_28875 [Deltaproteobacteria bacterium]|nr:MAG: hypothetical protein DRI57_28875 [Deltaproteobacteria bacterium]